MTLIFRSANDAERRRFSQIFWNTDLTDDADDTDFGTQMTLKGADFTDFWERR
jgi:hypothetical protein